MPSGNSVVDVLVEQLINSAIVAGIAAIATWSGASPDVIVMGKAFALTFLIELRKYRGIVVTSSPPTSPTSPSPGA
jgi:hypothetical protein